MKTTRIDIEGPNGEATITRDGRRMEINGRRLVTVIETKQGRTCPVKKAFRLLADALNGDKNDKVARALQQHLDGYRGTNGDMDEYRRVIATFED